MFFSDLGFEWEENPSSCRKIPAAAAQNTSLPLLQSGRKDVLICFLLRDRWLYVKNECLGLCSGARFLRDSYLSYCAHFESRNKMEN